MSEKTIQSKCVMWFSQEFTERRGDLVGTFQETLNAAQGANMLSLGLIPGVSDLLYLNDGVLTGIEMKAPKTYHDTVHVLEQCRFILKNCYDGWFCISIDMFQDIIHGGMGIDPLDVVEWCREKVEQKVKLSGNEDVDGLLLEAKVWEKKSKKKLSKIKF